MQAATIGFDADRVGAAPVGWTAGVTGRGASRWTVEADASAPSAPNVLRQSGVGDFPWCVRKDVALADGFVEVRFKPIEGKQDRAGGVVWRWKDGDRYYVARANALEDNVSLYYTERGRRITLKYVDAPVAAGVWHVLRAEFDGDAHPRPARRQGSTSSSTTRTSRGRGPWGCGRRPTASPAFDDFAYGAPAAR